MEITPPRLLISQMMLLDKNDPTETRLGNLNAYLLAHSSIVYYFASLLTFQISLWEFLLLKFKTFKKIYLQINEV